MDQVIPIALDEVQARFGNQLYRESFVVRESSALWLMRAVAEKRLALLTSSGSPLLEAFHGKGHEWRDGYRLRLCPLTQANARALCAHVPNLKPTPLGLGTSAGFGDRLGLATPGHVRALRAVGSDIAPIFAQQSIREMARTGRTPEDVLADATWGAFEAGWRGPLGADADHLKTTEDIDRCAVAGFTFFTFDPGAYVDNAADAAPVQELVSKFNALPWPALESTPLDFRQRYTGQQVDCDGFRVTLEAEAVMRAAVKYGRAVAHVLALYRHLVAKTIPFEVEISVDETETPTRHAEHIIIASELKRLGVRWVSLAPRFVGRFEKGVDYLGNLEALRRDLDGHAAIARALGPYKLSLHSGSDKFSVYALIVAATRGRVHLKTAGTSYLEALRAIAVTQPALFREILALAIERYPTDRATYHVSADVGRVPAPSQLKDDALPAILDDFDARQALHVTFGSALAQFGAGLKAALREHEVEHYTALHAHFTRHLTPFRATVYE